MECEDEKHLWETYITRAIALPPPHIEGETEQDGAHHVMREQKKCIHCGIIRDLFPKPEDEETKSWEVEEEELPEPELEEEERTTSEQEYINNENKGSDDVEFGTY